MNIDDRRPTLGPLFTHFGKFQMAISQQYTSSDRLRVWFYGGVCGDGGSYIIT